MSDRMADRQYLAREVAIWAKRKNMRKSEMYPQNPAILKWLNQQLRSGELGNEWYVNILITTSEIFKERSRKNGKMWRNKPQSVYSNGGCGKSVSPWNRTFFKERAKQENLKSFENILFRPGGEIPREGDELEKDVWNSLSQITSGAWETQRTRNAKVPQNPCP